MIIIINIKILLMKKIHNLTLINVMYVAYYYSLFKHSLPISGFIFHNWNWRLG